MSDNQSALVTWFTATLTCLCIPIVLVVTFMGLAIGITDIVIGTKYLNSSCHINNLAEYLIVIGVTSIMCFLVRCNRKYREGNENDTPDDSEPSCMEWLLRCIHVSILIWGMTLVWDTKQIDCQSLFYEYAYYRTIIDVFIGAGILALAVLYCICSLSIIACCDTDSNTSCIIECGSCITGKKPKPNQQLQANLEKLNQMNPALDRITETIHTRQQMSEHVTVTLDKPDVRIEMSSTC